MVRNLALKGEWDLQLFAANIWYGKYLVCRVHSLEWKSRFPRHENPSLYVTIKYGNLEQSLKTTAMTGYDAEWNEELIVYVHVI